MVGPVDRHRLDRRGRRLDRVDRRARRAPGGAAERRARRPGPACFGLGGTEPTVTDCHLLLGRLDPDASSAVGCGSTSPPPSGRAEPDRRARSASASRRRRPASSRSRETNMAYAIQLDDGRARTRSAGVRAAPVRRRWRSVRRGHRRGARDPAVVVPRAPANFSAWGILTSDYREDAALTRVRPLDEPGAEALARPPASSAAEAAANLERLRIRRGTGRADRSCRPALRRAGAHDHRAVEAAWLDDARALLAGVRSASRRAPPALRARRPRRAARGRHRQVSRIGLVATPAWPAWTGDVEPARAAGVTRPVRFGARGRIAPPPSTTARRSPSPASRPGDRRGVDDHDRRAAGLVARTRPAREPRARQSER